MYIKSKRNPNQAEGIKIKVRLEINKTEIQEWQEKLMKLKDDSMKTLIKLMNCRKTDKGKKREDNLHY